MDCKKQNQQLAQLCSQQLASERDPIERFKCHALKNGAAGIKNVGRKFRIMDNTGDRKLDFDEFMTGCRECRIAKMTPDELREVFNHFDKDHSGKLDYEEFLIAVQPRMGENRKMLVKKAFAKMDKSGDGIITIDDILETYDVRMHPKFQNGEMTKREVLMEFLGNFEADDHKDGKVTLEEWIHYYAGISVSIDDDAYFSLMMYNSWKVKPTD